MTRHCKKCNADVEDTGGYCLLGHPLRLNMETASLDDLRKEIDEVFGSAQDDVREALSPLIEQVESAPAAVAQPQPEPAMAAAVATMPARYAAPPVQPVSPPVTPSAPPAAQRVAPPPPPPKRQQTQFESLWESFENQETPAPLDSGDPINAFAPPPRMDWGPERSSKKGRGLRRLRVSNA